MKEKEIREKNNKYFNKCKSNHKLSKEYQKKEILYAECIVALIVLPAIFVMLTEKYYILYLIYLFLFCIYYCLLKPVFYWNLLIDKDNKKEFIIKFEDYILDKIKKQGNTTINWRIKNKQYKERPSIKSKYVSSIRIENNDDYELIRIKSFLGINYISFPNGKNINGIIEDIRDCFGNK